MLGRGFHLVNAPKIARVAIAPLLGALLFAVTAPGAWAQGCAMCYQNAAASGPQGVKALQHGILVLLVPTLSMFVGLLTLVYRRRDVSRADDPISSEESVAPPLS